MRNSIYIALVLFSVLLLGYFFNIELHDIVLFTEIVRDFLAVVYILANLTKSHSLIDEVSEELILCINYGSHGWILGNLWLISSPILMFGLILSSIKKGMDGKKEL